MSNTGSCINCGKPLTIREGLRVCPHCNSEQVLEVSPFLESSDDDLIFIECPGATLYEDGSDRVSEGVRFIDDSDPSKGFEIVKRQVFAPTHTKRRRIKKEALGKIRRCQGCQDMTVRMRRKEGPDFCIPSVKHPGRTKLKSVLPVEK
jgi:hypothetical protein